MDTPGTGSAPALHVTVPAVLASGLTLVWGATGFGAFWPGWVWFGLGLPLALHAGLRWALGVPAGWTRALAVHAVFSGVAAGSTLAIWALAGFGTFWPAWPLFGIGVVFAIHVAAWNRFSSASTREAELARRVDVLTRTRRGALDVQAAELRRIERDLHDGAQARLVALSMQLGRAEARLADDRPELAELLREARGEASAAIAELRDLARGISPPVLADRGLRAAIEALGQRAPMEVDVDVRLECRPAPVVETAAYFVVAEALTNVAKHAGGAGARVTVAARDDVLTVVVADDGPGGADAAHGSGLTGLRHRVEAIDGTLTVTTTAGKGTAVRGELPCAS